jgi:DNA polymerase I
MSQNKKKLFLLDAMALIYRAHFAFSKNPIINSKGTNTGAILGFTNSLVEILTKEQPGHIAVAFDTSAPTFRKETFAEYKAQREAQPEDIQVAIPLVKKIIDAFQVKRIESDGYEADDIIGTIAKKASKDGFTVYMMTPDKDFSQLVEENIFLYKPAYMGNGVDILGIPEVLKKFGIDKVDQVRDVLGLQGDSIDNIPGIPGIGAKTATKLLKEYETVENIVANADQFKGKLQERIIEFGQQGILSKELATIKIDVPLDFDHLSCEYKGYNYENLREIFDELEFRSLARRLMGEDGVLQPEGKQLNIFDTPPSDKKAIAPEVSSFETIETVDHKYHLINSPEERQEIINKIKQAKQFCFDTETTSLDSVDASLVGMSISIKPKEGYYLPFPMEQEETTKVLADFKPVFEDTTILKIGQNLKYDVCVLNNYGIEIKGVMFDTMIAHYLIEPDSRHNMTLLAENYLNYKPIPIEDLIGKKGKKQDNMKNVAIEKIKEYAAEDADVTLQLKEKLEPLLQENKVDMLYYEIEAPLIPVLANMEKNGVKIDVDFLGVLSREMNVAIGEIEQSIFKIAGVEFNIGSPKQLGEVLFEKMKLLEKPKKTRTGQYATGEEVLSKLAIENEVCRRILDYRELVKLKSTYIDALPNLLSPIDSRLHTTYNQAVAATGRLSSNNPNLQNIPIRTDKGREIRKAFIPRNDDFILLSADYSQVELRIMASFSKDEVMMDAFKAGKDIHSATAAKIFKVPLEQVDTEMRRRAKTANFGIIYGISAWGLSERLSIPRREAADIIKAYWEEFPAVKKYMDDIINTARQNEYVETITGRRRYLRDINSRNATMRGFSERNAINAPIQGSAADIIKKAMIEIHDWLIKEKMKTKMILQVHDELVFDVYHKEKEIVAEKVTEIMQNAANLDVPLIVESGFGENWLAAH